MFPPPPVKRFLSGQVDVRIPVHADISAGRRASFYILLRELRCSVSKQGMPYFMDLVEVQAIGSSRKHRHSYGVQQPQFGRLLPFCGVPATEAL